MEKMNVLIIDEEDISQSLSSITSDFGYNTTYRTHAQEAIQYIQENRVHIAIVDLMLDNSKEKTGIHLIQKIKAINTNIVILLLTGK